MRVCRADLVHIAPAQRTQVQFGRTDSGQCAIAGRRGARDADATRGDEVYLSVGRRARGAGRCADDNQIGAPESKARADFTGISHRHHTTIGYPRQAR